jgi:hypothetical protein
MKDTYALRIRCSQPTIKEIEKTLGKASSDLDNGFWEWLVEDNIKPTDAFQGFLSLLNGKYDELAKIGVTRDHISIWRNYEYDQECSLEISPQQMISLGEQGIVLCISCWQHH